MLNSVLTTFKNTVFSWGLELLFRKRRLVDVVGAPPSFSDPINESGYHPQAAESAGCQFSQLVPSLESCPQPMEESASKMLHSQAVIDTRGWNVDLLAYEAANAPEPPLRSG